MPLKGTPAQADICLVLEGTYPFVRGGVASWAHDLILNQPNRTFSIVTIVAPNIRTKMRYTLPKNVVSLNTIRLQELPRGRQVNKSDQLLFDELEPMLLKFQQNAEISELHALERVLAPHRAQLGSNILLDSPLAWQMLQHMYSKCFCGGSFLDYFWSWRCLLGGLFSVLLGEVPQARVYHTLCTGYAGIFAARASLQFTRPLVLTEHGLYTNERRVELGTADWFHDIGGTNMSVTSKKTELRELWGNAFASYSRICYQASRKIITLFDENSQEQTAEGADPSKQQVIPNGIDIKRFKKKVFTSTASLLVAIIGRVVPIKGIKAFIQAAVLVLVELPNTKFFIIGPSEEDPQYTKECRDLVRHFELEKSLVFTGSLDLATMLPEIDLVVLTSLSEAQPLVILEAGACAVPVVATDVGSCRELVFGKHDEAPQLGAGGSIAGVADVEDIANKMLLLLNNQDLRQACGEALFKRVSQYYTAESQHAAYRTVYNQLLIEEVERSTLRAA